MKILFVTGNYLPGKKGGIENYTHYLAKLLQTQGFHVEVAALSVQEGHDYIFDEVLVNLTGRSTENFSKLLREKQFDICHFHEYSSFGGIEIPWFRIAKEFCKKVYFTFHIPYLTCYKGDFRYKGVSDCNTFTDAGRCANCNLISKLNIGMLQKGPLAGVLEKAISYSGITGKFRHRVAARTKDLDALISLCDKVFVLANWFKQLLADNGYDSENIVLLPHKPLKPVASGDEADNAITKHRLVFIGRIQQIKGLHLLCEAMSRLENKELQVDVYGDIMEADYFDSCKAIYHFNYKGTVSQEVLLAQLKQYDFLVLPSVVPEMLPLVILDAFQHSLPVIASSSKGNRDVVNSAEKGFLFEYGSAASLTETIRLAYEKKAAGWKPSFERTDAAKSTAELVSYYLN
ncbi:glycosyltransferase [Ferruginibacter sp. HRS2-29]|uniref:glycosyltransferase n=1 Tax=Ferruginibacter sp. HRS2-29 TaxID=2487334 RepID=UPI0020CCE0EA|nr:glycosyltransferase [Ferruginibacter sp. HRS2-29]MCP9751932.1 glycosyltransferase [Ferruginibacter sp. HRS2-29]